MFTYIAVLDYNHLDNGVFLTAIGRALAQQSGNIRAILIHGDSEYTERLIQTGMMRSDARNRSIKDLNHRLVALFADQGVSVVGINGYQREFITRKGGALDFDHSFYKSLPSKSVLLLSNLVMDAETDIVEPVELPNYLNFLRSEIEPDEAFLFSVKKSDEVIKNNELEDTLRWDEMDTNLKETYIPEEFHHYNKEIRLINAQSFGNLPEQNRGCKIY
ncbi:MAG: hypothetical protein R3211_06940 [Balneolaceae bacterium]|nr:hypothetical protein [Balneolaceae bacterium]